MEKSKKNHIQFFIGKLEGDGYLAASKTEPYFCIERSTEAEVIKAALEAWNFYLSAKGSKKKSTAKVTKKSPFTSLEKRFTPEQVVFAEAS